MILRFVQLSDIHFGQERNGSLPEHDDVRKRLVVDAAKLSRERGPANMVLVVGDTAYSGKKHEFDRAGLWLDELTKAVGCPEKAVRIVPGNHDCDREKVDYLCRMVHDSIRRETPKSAHGHLEKASRSSEDQNPLLPKLRAYRDFASGYDSDFDSIGQPLWRKEFEFPNGITLRLIGMNSVQVCDDSDQSGKMILGNTQYILDPEPHVISVVLVHHPLNWFMDKNEAEAYLHTRTHLIMVGHEHIPRINKVSTPDHERVDLSSGATNPPDQTGGYKHTFNWIEISCVTIGDVITLKIDAFARTWVPENADFAPDSPRMFGKDSISFDIVCHKAKPRDQLQKQPDSAALPPSSAGANSAPSSVSNDGASMKISEDDVAQLRFLFWRHLNWQQRLKVLVEADVLPASADKPVSQTLERIALENARSGGKLAAVWDAMMKLLPEEKRQANPFK